jgi:hypothetical protein
MKMKILFAAAMVILPLTANDVVYLHGQVRMPDGAEPDRTIEIKLSCGSAEPTRQTLTDKKGTYNLRVERDEFNHIVRALPATTTDIGGEPGPCLVLAVVKGYDSNRIDLGTFVIGKDLALPNLVLKPAGKKP